MLENRELWSLWQTGKGLTELHREMLVSPASFSHRGMLVHFWQILSFFKETKTKNKTKQNKFVHEIFILKISVTISIKKKKSTEFLCEPNNHLLNLASWPLVCAIYLRH